MGRFLAKPVFRAAVAILLVAASGCSRQAGPDGQDATAMSAKDEVVVREKSKRSKTPTVTLAASAASVDFGGSVTLNWSSTNATSCSAAGDWSGSRPVAGTATIVDIRSNQTYTLSCSGKKGSASQSTSVTIAAPSVSASLSQAKALVNESVTLQWTSTGATACTVAGDASATGGPSGSQVLSFGSPADRTFTVTCTNAARSASASVNLSVFESTTYSVRTDLTKVSYPSGYMATTTRLADINKDPCKLDLDVVTYPKEWLGRRALPEIQGAPLKPGHVRGVSIKDIMLSDNPAFVLDGAPDAPRGCKGSLQDEFVRLVARLKSLNIEFVQIPQWHWLTRNADDSWRVLKAEDVLGPLSDADLSAFVKLAHAAGMKVMIVNQIQGMVDTPTSRTYWPPNTRENLEKWYAAFQPFIVERARVYESMGVDIIETDCSSCWVLKSDTGRGTPDGDLIIAETKKTLANLRAVFSGKIVVFAHPWLPDEPELGNAVDYIKFRPYVPPLTQDQSDGITAASYRELLDRSGIMDYFVRMHAKFGKPFIVAFSLQSRVNALTRPGYLEESVCTPGFDTFEIDPSNCMQRATPPDFALQAIFYEAVLEHLNSLDSPVPFVLLPGDYWVTESLTPQTAWPNIAESIRNKPAEGILRAWYAR